MFISLLLYSPNGSFAVDKSKVCDGFILEYCFFDVKKLLSSWRLQSLHLSIFACNASGIQLDGGVIAYEQKSFLRLISSDD